MSEPIRAKVKLRCTLATSAVPEPKAEGATEEVARDSAVVTVEGGVSAKWLRPRSEVSLTIELPSTRGFTPRALACGAVVCSVKPTCTGVRVELRIVSMEFRACV